MTQIDTSVRATTAVTATETDKEKARTRALLTCGAVAGPAYILVAAVQVATRDGFDITRHALSQLSLGELGFIQVTNFLVAGLLFVACAVGMRRAMSGGRGATWAPRLVGVFGVSLLVAGVFPADAAFGFPVGTPDGPGVVTWHGIVHNIAPAVAFPALIILGFVLGRYYSARGRRGRAIASRIVGLALLTPDFFLGRPAFGLAMSAATVLGWGWVSLLAARLRRELA